jgi:hypothetical protein
MRPTSTFYRASQAAVSRSCPPMDGIRRAIVAPHAAGSEESRAFHDPRGQAKPIVPEDQIKAAGSKRQPGLIDGTEADGRAIARSQSKGTQEMVS